MKFLGEGAGTGAGAQGRQPFACMAANCASDGPFRQRQDHAAFGARLHSVADARERSGLRPVDGGSAQPEQLAKLQARSYRLRLPVLSSVSDADRPGQCPSGAGRARRALPASDRKRSRTRWPRVGLAHKINAFPRELSGGEQQRVAIARAIVGDAAAILADEPTAALDSENGHSIMTMLARDRQGSGRGVLVVTHDPRILPFASRIIRIEDGLIVGEEAGVGAARTPVAKARSVAKP